MKTYKDGEIYQGDLQPGAIIFKPHKGELYSNSIDEIHSFSNVNYPNTIKNIKVATAEQKHWYLACEKVCSFITKEKALKTFNNKVDLDYEIY